ncbi:unnamed protein product [Prunus armeniaca]
MAKCTLLLLGLLLALGCALTSSKSIKAKHLDAESETLASLNRSSFPKGFVFGTASSAYQYEGAAKEGGRGPCIWDTYMHKHPERITDHSTGDVAVDEYHRYKEDVQIMKDIGLDAYRFSISWSRVIPEGKLSGGVNYEGINYYKNLINELLANGLTPFVTIFHWDLPQGLEDDYGGFLSPNIVDDFQDYAELCFREFGGKVKHWITLNEPLSYSKNGYATGKYAPGRCSDWLKLNCLGGDSGTEPYLVTHHQLLAHAAAVKLYKDKYQASQKGSIGITLNTDWFVPVSDEKKDKDAASRALDFSYGWFMDPLTKGHYPQTMQSLVKNRLPEFTKEQSEMLKGSFDFIGLNYYSGTYAADVPRQNDAKPNYKTDALVNQSVEHNGVPIGPLGASDWLHVYPRGFRDLLLYTKRNYQNPLIYITENGYDDPNDPKIPMEESLADKKRIDYLDRHLYYLHKAIQDGVNVMGYFIWSLFDNIEWNTGYTVRFGINYIDFKNGLKRHPKQSADWLKKFLKTEKHVEL